MKINNKTNRLVVFLVLFLLLVYSFFIISSHDVHYVNSWNALILTLGLSVTLWLPGFAIAALFKNKMHDDLQPILMIIGVGFSGYFYFVSWFIFPWFGFVISSFLVLVSVLVLIIKGLPSTSLLKPTMLTLLFSILYVAMSGDHGGLEQANNTIAHRYWVSVDNSIPAMFADHLMLGKSHLTGFLVGDWLSSDRPPLQTGMMMSAYHLASIEMRGFVAFILGVASNMLWVFGLWSFLRALKMTHQHCGVIIIGVGLIGPVFINVVYVWPKFLAASFIMASAALLLQKKINNTVSTVLISALFALGMLAHGAIIFGIFGLAPLLIGRRDLVSIKNILLLVFIGLFIYSPWMVYQKTFNPPGDRLLKWHLAGQISLTDEPLHYLISNNYKEMGIKGTVKAKLVNLAVIMGVQGSEEQSLINNPLPNWAAMWDGKIRQRMLSSVILTPGLALSGLMMLFFVWRNKPWLNTMLKILAATTLSYCLIEYGGDVSALTWLHTAPLSLLLIWPALVLSLCLGHAIAIRTILLCNTLFFIWLWGVRTIDYGAAEDYVAGELSLTMIATQVIIFCFLAYYVWVWTGKTENNSNFIGLKSTD